MIDRFLSVRRVFILLFLLIFVSITSGCIPDWVVRPDAPNCVASPDSKVNPYLYAMGQISKQLSDAGIGYQNSIADPYGARQRALLQLADDAEHLSDQANIATNDTNMVRIVITYLDPELIQYVVLNHYLNDPERLSENKDVVKFNNELKQRLQRFAERDEILFLVTITSPFYKENAYNSDVLTVKIPITELKLINGSGKEFRPKHTDYILSTDIDITHGPVSGVVGYPIFNEEQGQCVWLIDQYTNSLTLELPRVVLGKDELGRYYWNITYRSLIMPDNNKPNPTYDPRMATPVGKLDTPPTPHWIPNATEDPTDKPKYWDEMARYIWSYLIAESHQ